MGVLRSIGLLTRIVPIADLGFDVGGGMKIVFRDRPSPSAKKWLKFLDRRVPAIVSSYTFPRRLKQEAHSRRIIVQLGNITNR